MSKQCYSYTTCDNNKGDKNKVMCYVWLNNITGHDAYL